MQTLTIQLPINLDCTESVLHDAFKVLHFLLDKRRAVASLRAYNRIFAVILRCRQTDSLPLSVLSDLQSRLASFHDDVLSLNGVR